MTIENAYQELKQSVTEEALKDSRQVFFAGALMVLDQMAKNGGGLTAEQFMALYKEIKEAFRGGNDR